MRERSPLKPEDQQILDELRQMIENVEEHVETSFEHSLNSWAAVFAEKIFVIETYLGPLERRALISVEQSTEMQAALEKLKEMVFKLKELYPAREHIPARYVKDEVIAEFKKLLLLLRPVK